MEISQILEHHILDHVWKWIAFGPLHLPISKHFFMMIVSAFILLVIFPVVIRSKGRFFSPVRSMIEAVALFIRDDVILPNLGKSGLRYWHCFSTLFFFILFCNLLGLVPYGATATGNLAVTGTLALTALAFIVFSGAREQGPVNFIKHIVPSGVPVWLVPLLFPIEIVGLLTKTFALCVRLFANMIAGHIVILSFLGLIFIFGKVSLLLGLGAVAPLSIVMILFVSLLEIFVAFLQAYIFVFLTAIFAGMAMHPH